MIKKYFKQGFTLIELTVSIAIIGIIFGIVIINFGKSGRGIVLTNIAYELALLIRQAQTYGLSVKGTDTSSFDVGYGVVVQNDKLPIFFIDENKNGLKDTGEKIIETLKFPVNYRIPFIRIYNPSSDTSTSINNATIDFKRPNPDASIKYGIYDTTFDSGSITDDKKLLIRIGLNNSSEGKWVIVERTGQISVSDDYRDK